MMRKAKYASLADKLASGVRAGGADECWPWTKSLTVHGGYGQFSHGRGVLKKAHRVAYELAFGEVPAGLFVCHKCNNPRCCNPAHLYAGTPAENWADTRAAGRAHKFAVLRGSASNSAKLSEADVMYVRGSSEPGIVLARRFGVTNTAITNIRKGRVWKHLPLKGTPSENADKARWYNERLVKKLRELEAG